MGMSTHIANKPYTYACGCVLHADQAWTLCADCAARIGIFGTCLSCSGPANGQWVASCLPDETFCSRDCAEHQARLEELED